jgi:beta-N-acetylhexosaminidase
MEKKIKKVHLVFSLILGLLVIIELIYLFTLKPFYFPLNLPQLQPVSVEEELIEKKISQMSLEEKVGALFIVGFSGQTMTESTKEFINTHHFRHFLLLGRNISTPEQLKELTGSLKEATASSIPSLITIDQEGGQVARIQFAEIDNTSQAEIASNAQAYKVGRNRGEVLKDLGINLNLSPVVEVIREEDSYLDRLGRSFPGNEEQVFLLSKAMIQGYQDSGLVPFAKHFPGGLGRKSIDPHQDLPVLEINRAQLNQDLLPLAQLIKQGKISTLMSTHILYPQIDPENPVTTSEKFISAILRGDLHFKGVLISDDLIMRGISSDRTVEQAAIAAFKAGHDLLIISGPSQLQDRVYQALLEAVRSGEITEERINITLKRLLQLHF